MASLPPQPIEGAASPRHPPARVFMCAHCGASFNSASALRDHKKQKVDQESKEDNFITHVYCCLCDLDFGSRGAAKTHWNENHAQKQNINCPGCAAHFVKFSGFVQHIEFNLCPKISQEIAADRCKMSLDFARGLEERDRESADTSRPKDFSRFLGGEQEPSKSVERVSWAGATSDPWNKQSAEGWAPPGFRASEKSKFPRMTHREYLHGDTKIPDLLTGDDENHLDGKQGVNPWASGKNLFPDAPPAQRPTSEQLDQLRVDQSLAVTRAHNNFQFDVDDPNSLHFSADRYLNPYTKKYSCPKCRAGKSSHKTKSALVQHLRSAAHKFEKEVSCPSCFSIFKSLHALAAHCEAEAKKCNFRHSDMYGMFLQQLTWNLVEVTGEHKEDGTKKYDITQKAKEDYGIVKPARPQPTFGHQQVYGSKPPTPHSKQGDPQRVYHQNQPVMRASGAPWQSVQYSHPDYMSNSGHSHGAASQYEDCSRNFFEDGSSHQAQHNQQQSQVDGARCQTMQTHKSQPRSQQQAQRVQPRNQSQAQQQKQQQQQRGHTAEIGSLTAEALSKLNLQQAKNARFQLDGEREHESADWGQGHGSWGLGRYSDANDECPGW